jgi:hypothetical protein
MSDTKLLSLQQRRQLEKEIAALANTQNDLELTQAARAIVHGFPASAALNALLKHLDTSSSQLRGGLAHIATLLPPESVAPALRQYAALRQNPVQARLTAAMILERYLGEKLSPGVVGDLQGSDEAAFQSLCEAVDEGKTNRYVLLEYVMQMQEHNEEIAFAVLDALNRLPEGDRVDLLRLIAQDDRPRVRQTALAQLDLLAAPGGNAAAVRALTTLCAVLSPAEIEASERTLRKLKMRGKGYQTPAIERERALLSPADPAGNQLLCLVYPVTLPVVQPVSHFASQSVAQIGQPCSIFVNLVVNQYLGIVGFYVNEEQNQEFLAEKQPVGSVFKLQGERGVSWFLEAEFGYGLWLAQNALRVHKETKRPALGNEYKLYNDLIWQYPAPQLPKAVQTFLDFEQASADLQAEVALDSEQIEADALALLEHAAMADWMLAAPAGQRAAHALLESLPTRQLVRVVLNEIDRLPELGQLLASLETGLRVQAAWLELASQPETAQQALRMALVMRRLPVLHNPFLRGMVEKGSQAFKG